MSFQEDKEYFAFNEQRFNYWPIYDTIKQYYPLGIYTNEESRGLYDSYPGSKALQSVIHNNIWNKKNFSQGWSEFEKFLRQYFKRQVIGTTYANAPSFSSYVLLEKTHLDKLFHYKELHFTVSLLGPFYTIYGLDFTGIKLEEIWDPLDTSNRRIVDRSSISAITTSPYLEYETHFIDLEAQIKQRYPQFRMVPFNMNMKSIKGLRTGLYLQQENCVFHALFNEIHSLADTHIVRGDKFYGHNEWRI
ncbi:hypothetical protein [Hymenobacter sp. BT730]|uniref:hypothetical protein n=1 Tax=Hymenobacter sp. BT730 TaxID=3063332 RepID=UPI0026E0C396|nr:hypothetical protein [Hymenobacter sp. BT730]